MVHNLSIKDGGNEIVANTLHLVSCQAFLPSPGGSIIHTVGFCQDATVRIHSYYLDSRNLLLQFLGSARNCSSCACSHDHVVQLPVGLFNDFFSCAIIVSKRVPSIKILVQ